jgi:hypothetical protein
MKRIAAIAAVVVAVVAIVAPTATAGKSQSSKLGVRTQPRLAYEQNGQSVWWAGNRQMY